MKHSAERLTVLATEILVSHGVPREDARYVARSLVVADLWGHRSHGLLRLGWYVDRLRTGAMTAVTVPEVVGEFGAVAVIDGGHGIGQIIAACAASEAVDRARDHGIGAAAVRNSNHFGTAAYFTRWMAEQGCVGILTTNGSPAMPPTGGRVKTFGANPWSIAVPAGRHGIAVLDIANTGVARGKIYAAAERGDAIPEGWATDADGTPTTDPAAAIAGIILPMAGHKGYAISWMMDVLSGVLTGSGFATDVAGPYQPEPQSRCGHLAIALDIRAVTNPAEFAERMEALVDQTKAVPLAAGATEIFFPGEIENRAIAESEPEGLDLPDATIESLRRLGDEAGLALTIA